MLREFLRHLSLELYRSDLTVEAYSTDLRGFNDFLSNSGIPKDDTGFFVASAVTVADIREWIAFLTDAGMSAASVSRKIQSVRAYFKYLVKQGVLSSSPAASIPLPKRGRKLPEIATPTEIDEVIDNSAPLESLVIEMLYGCGLRRAELLRIVDSDINPYSKELKILGKGNKHRIVPLADSTLEKILGWQKERDRKYPDLPEPKPLIATRRGAMSESTLYSMVRKALQATTASRKSPHTLRHSFATALLNSGADINSVKELLGHSSLTATEIYTHVAFEDLKRDWGKAHPRASAKSDKEG